MLAKPTLCLARYFRVFASNDLFDNYDCTNHDSTNMWTDDSFFYFLLWPAALHAFNYVNSDLKQHQCKMSPRLVPEFWCQEVINIQTFACINFHFDFQVLFQIYFEAMHYLVIDVFTSYKHFLASENTQSKAHWNSLRNSQISQMHRRHNSAVPILYAPFPMLLNNIA